MTSDLEKEISRVEKVFTERLAHGDRRRAMQKLRVPTDGFHSFDWTTFGLGMWAMFFVFCMTIIVIIAFRTRVADYPDHRVMFPMYRGLLYPLVMIAFVAINMYVWRKHHINYILIFGLDHRRHTNYIKMLHTAGQLAGLWSVSVFVYLFQDELGGDVSPWSAVAFLCFLVLYWFHPWGSMRRARYWLAKVIGRMVTAPLFSVRFEDFWLADQFNSLVVVFLDYEYLFCVLAKRDYSGDGAQCRGGEYIARAVIAALPPWWRLAQCIRRYRDTNKVHHIHNALKYLSSIVVVIFSTTAGVVRDRGDVAGESPTGTAWFVLWGLACLVNTSFATYWDLCKDWGLFASGAKKHRFLRRDLLYPPAVYYLAMVNNVVFRLAWTLSISVGYFDLFFSDGLVAMIALGEMWRRFCWNFFRLENEHLNNCGEFRAVRRIPMPFEYAPAESEHYTDESGGEGSTRKGNQGSGEDDGDDDEDDVNGNGIDSDGHATQLPRFLLGSSGSIATGTDTLATSFGSIGTMTSMAGTNTTATTTTKEKSCEGGAVDLQVAVHRSQLPVVSHGAFAGGFGSVGDDDDDDDDDDGEDEGNDAGEGNGERDDEEEGERGSIATTSLRVPTTAKHGPSQFQRGGSGRKASAAATTTALGASGGVDGEGVLLVREDDPSQPLLGGKGVKSRKGSKRVAFHLSVFSSKNESSSSAC